MNRYLPVLATALVFAAGYGLCAAQFPAFLSTRVVGNLLTDSAFLGIVAVGMTVVIVSGGIDLSIGAVIAVTGVFLALAIERWGLPPLAAFALRSGSRPRSGRRWERSSHSSTCPPSS